MNGRISRRRLLAWIASVSGMAVARAGADEEKPSDRGIGGTGISADADVRIVRGVGFIGTIQRFGSIYVNDARITYPKDVPVLIDGQRRGASALAIGQVVRTIARKDGGRLVTDHIEVVSEVIGPIGSVTDRTLVVLGQTVLLGDAKRPSWWQPGARVRVSGVRTADGSIVGTYMAPAGDLPDQVAGVPALHGWNLRIGALPLLGIAEQYAGWRVIVRGTPSPGGFRVGQVRLDAPFEGRDVSRISVETYITRSGSEFRSGAGVDFRDVQLDRVVSEHGNVHAILKIDVDRAGGLRLHSLAIEGGFEAVPRPFGPLLGNGSTGRMPGSGIALSPDGPGGSTMRGAVGLGGGPSGPGGPAAGGSFGGGNWGPGDGYRGRFDGRGPGGLR